MSAKKPPRKRPTDADSEAFDAYEPDQVAYPNARAQAFSSEDVTEVLKAWEGSNWAKAQAETNAGVIDERVGVGKEDEKLWKGWRHTAEVTRWVVPSEGGKLVALDGSPVKYTKTVRCPHCKNDLAYTSSTTVIKTHSLPHDVFPSLGCTKNKPKYVSASAQQGGAPTLVPATAILHNLQDLAVRFLAIMALPFNFFAHPIVKLFLFVYRSSALNIVTDRILVRDASCATADSDRTTLLAKLKNQSVTVAVDGGTLHGRKLFGIGLVAALPRMEDERGWFWKLHTVLSQSNLSVSTRLIQTLTVLTIAVVWVVCVVGDNHPGLQLGLRKAALKHTFLVLRCACHSIQLLVKDILKNLPDYVNAKHLQDYVTQNMTPTIQAQLPRKIVKFCETRWSTEYDSLCSLLDMRHELNTVFPEFLSVIASTTKWLCVKKITDLLMIFKISTKVLESDSATLIDVVCVLVGLMQNFRGATEEPIFRALTNRIEKNFASHAMFVVLFAIPGFLGYLVANGLGELAQQIVDVTLCVAAKAIFARDQSRFAAMGVSFTTTFQEVSDQMRVLVDKWVAQSKPPYHTALGYTPHSLLAFWAKMMLAMGGLAEFVVAVLSCVPSEAIVERIFSHSKLVLDSCRVRMGEKATEDQSFIKFNDPKRYPKPKQPLEDSLATKMEELKSFTSNWIMLSVLATHVGIGLQKYPTNNGGDAEGRWKPLSPFDSDESDAEDPGDDAEDEEDD